MSHATRLPVADLATTWRVILKLLRPHAAVAVLAAVLMVIGAGAGVAVPVVIGRIVDVVVDGRSGSLLTFGLALIGLAAVAAAATGVAQVVIAGFGEPSVAVLRERVLRHSLLLAGGRVEEAGSGDVMTRISRDVSLLGDVVRLVLAEFAGASLTLVLTIAGLAVLDWRLMLAALVATPVQTLGTRRYLRAAIPIYAEESVAYAEQTQQLLDSLGGAETVTSLGLTDQHVARISLRANRVRALALRAVRIRTRFFQDLNIAEWVGTSAILAVAFVLVRSDQVTPGVATAAALMFVRLFGPINTVLALLDDVQAAGAGLARLVGLLAEPAQALGAPGPQPGPTGLRARAVTYRYPSRGDDAPPALAGVTLELARGERVALVGTSGAGKSTLAAVMAGLRPASQGEVSVEEGSLAALSPARVRRTVAVVTQDVHIFAGTLRDDLALAAPEADDDQLRGALRRVRAGWADDLPDGLDTLVGAGGHPLTPVQAQQVALARILLLNPPAVILDEATAEAGSSSAEHLEAAAEAVIEGRTALVIAHRLSQADRCDRVAVMDAGRIIEVGCPDELKARSEGAYARLWEAWNYGRSR